MNKTLLTLLCVMAAGCSVRNEVTPDTMQIATAPLICANPAECAAWWQRAHDWVAGHSIYPLRPTGDAPIETARPDGGKPALAYQSIRIPNDDGTATIDVAARCDSRLGCKPNPWEAGAVFKQFVRHGTADALPGEGAAAPMMTTPAASQDSPTGAPVSR